MANNVKVPNSCFRFEPSSNITILQIGCGGTGSLLVPQVSRFISASNYGEENKYDVKYIICDGDKVEKKNIVRQNFVEGDIGDYKANVLAKRYSKALGLSLIAVPYYVTSSDMNKICPDGVDIVVSCVDNNKTREILYDWHKNLSKNSGIPLWIDAGNEILGGQVFLTGQAMETGRWTDIVKSHPEIANGTDKLPTELSCAERANSGQQSLAVNLTASTIVFNIISALLRKEKVHYYEIDFTVGNSFKKKFLDDWGE